MNLKEKLWKTFISQIGLPENKILLQKIITEIVKFITVILMFGTTVVGIVDWTTTLHVRGPYLNQVKFYSTFHPFVVDKINTECPGELNPSSFGSSWLLGWNIFHAASQVLGHFFNLKILPKTVIFNGLQRQFVNVQFSLVLWQ